MTATITPSAESTLWGSMPGWGIVADLTPRELVEARRLNVLRKAIAVALLVVVLMCIAGYAWAFLKHRSASDDLTSAKGRSQQLAGERRQYSNVTEIQSMTQSVNSQINGLTANNVDVAILLARVRGSLPHSMSLTSMTVTISGASAGTNTAPSLDTSGHAIIGNVTLAGTSAKLVDLADYVTLLSGLKGVANVVPSSNAAATAGTAQWNVTLQLTDQLYAPHTTSTGGN